MANRNREAYIASLQGDETMQALDIGTGFDFNKPVKNKKADVIIGALAGCHIGYKLEYKNLATKRFAKWAANAAWFRTGDMLSPSDVKAAVREFYRRVATGELAWKDGAKKMLEFTRLVDGTMELKVSTFIPGMYQDTGKSSVESEELEPEKAGVVTEADLEAALEDVDVLASVEAMLAARISPAERAVLERARHDLVILSKKTA